MGILAQTELDWGAIFNSAISQYGAVIVLVLLVLAYIAITAFNINKRADQNEEFVLKTAKEATATKDDLIKVKDEFHAFQVLAGTDKGILLGRIDELSKMYAAAQARYEEKERAWEKEQRSLEERINKLSVQYTELLKDHNGNKAALAAVELERDLLKSQLADVERDKLELETKVAHLQNERDRLAAELATASTDSKLDATLPIPDMQAKSASMESVEVKEIDKEFTNSEKDKE